MKTISHPELPGQTARVPDASLHIWEARGWTVTDDEPPESLQAEPDVPDVPDAPPARRTSRPQSGPTTTNPEGI